MKNNDINKNRRPEWMEIISRYNIPDPVKSWWQIINSLGSYILLWVIMVKTIDISYWLTLGLSVFAAGFMVRTFIIFHDCGHGSFFKSAKLNRIVGIVTGFVVFTPFHKWTHDHKVHHQTVGNLDKRGIGDVKTLTVEEYSSLGRWQKLGYRLYRNPFFLFGIAPILLFTIQHRFTKKTMTFREKMYVHMTNLALITAVTLLIMAIGWKTYLLIQLPILYIATVHGVWLFYVQHQYRHVKWTESEGWDYKTIALNGSSLFKLPRLLNWFTGSIGYHHIHHLSPLIPNYNLVRCHKENAIFQEVKPLTFFSAFESLFLRLWDEKRQMLIRFNEVVKT
ncbi:MAG: fatty acid desaturase [Bacteroidales bacterium]|nr:fatty acid desaturase [Bacteroidales bacterium]MBK8884756.1 fatty acid desaturase [Bacteroidales bacterium]